MITDWPRILTKTCQLKTFHSRQNTEDDKTHDIRQKTDKQDTKKDTEVKNQGRETWDHDRILNTGEHDTILDTKDHEKGPKTKNKDIKVKTRKQTDRLNIEDKVKNLPKLSNRHKYREENFYSRQKTHDKYTRHLQNTEITRKEVFWSTARLTDIIIRDSMLIKKSSSALIIRNKETNKFSRFLFLLLLFSLLRPAASRCITLPDNTINQKGRTAKVKFSTVDCSIQKISIPLSSQETNAGLLPLKFKVYEYGTKPGEELITKQPEKSTVRPGDDLSPSLQEVPENKPENDVNKPGDDIADGNVEVEQPLTDVDDTENDNQVSEAGLNGNKVTETVIEGDLSEDDGKLLPQPDTNNEGKESNDKDENNENQSEFNTEGETNTEGEINTGEEIITEEEDNLSEEDGKLLPQPDTKDEDNVLNINHENNDYQSEIDTEDEINADGETNNEGEEKNEGNILLQPGTKDEDSVLDDNDIDNNDQSQTNNDVEINEEGDIHTSEEINIDESKDNATDKEISDENENRPSLNNVDQTDTIENEDTKKEEKTTQPKKEYVGDKSTKEDGKVTKLMTTIIKEEHSTKGIIKDKNDKDKDLAVIDTSDEIDSHIGEKNPNEYIITSKDTTKDSSTIANGIPLDNNDLEKNTKQDKATVITKEENISKQSKSTFAAHENNLIKTSTNETYLKMTAAQVTAVNHGISRKTTNPTYNNGDYNHTKKEPTSEKVSLGDLEEKITPNTENNYEFLKTNSNHIQEFSSQKMHSHDTTEKMITSQEKETTKATVFIMPEKNTSHENMPSINNFLTSIDPDTTKIPSLANSGKGTTIFENVNSADKSTIVNKESGMPEYANPTLPFSENQEIRTTEDKSKQFSTRNIEQLTSLKENKDTSKIGESTKEKGFTTNSFTNKENQYDNPSESTKISTEKNDAENTSKSNEIQKDNKTTSFIQKETIQKTNKNYTNLIQNVEGKTAQVSVSEDEISNHAQTTISKPVKGNETSELYKTTAPPNESFTDNEFGSKRSTIPLIKDQTVNTVNISSAGVKDLNYTSISEEQITNSMQTFFEESSTDKESNKKDISLMFEETENKTTRDAMKITKTTSVLNITSFDKNNTSANVSTDHIGDKSTLPSVDNDEKFNTNSAKDVIQISPSSQQHNSNDANFLKTNGANLVNTKNTIQTPAIHDKISTVTTDFTEEINTVKNSGSNTIYGNEIIDHTSNDKALTHTKNPGIDNVDGSSVMNTVDNGPSNTMNDGTKPATNIPGTNIMTTTDTNKSNSIDVYSSDKNTTRSAQHESFDVGVMTKVDNSAMDKIDVNSKTIIATITKNNIPAGATSTINPNLMNTLEIGILSTVNKDDNNTAITTANDDNNTGINTDNDDKNISTTTANDNNNTGITAGNDEKNTGTTAKNNEKNTGTTTFNDDKNTDKSFTNDDKNFGITTANDHKNPGTSTFSDDKNTGPNTANYDKNTGETIAGEDKKTGKPNANDDKNTGTSTVNDDRNIGTTTDNFDKNTGTTIANDNKNTGTTTVDNDKNIATTPDNLDKNTDENTFTTSNYGAMNTYDINIKNTSGANANITNEDGVISTIQIVDKSTTHAVEKNMVGTDGKNIDDTTTFNTIEGFSHNIINADTTYSDSAGTIKIIDTGTKNTLDTSDISTGDANSMNTMESQTKFFITEDISNDKKRTEATIDTTKDVNTIQTNAENMYSTRGTIDNIDKMTDSTDDSIEYHIEKTNGHFDTTKNLGETKTNHQQTSNYKEGFTTSKNSKELVTQEETYKSHSDYKTTLSSGELQLGAEYSTIHFDEAKKTGSTGLHEKLTFYNSLIVTTKPELSTQTLTLEGHKVSTLKQNLDKNTNDQTNESKENTSVQNVSTTSNINTGSVETNKQDTVFTEKQKPFIYSKTSVSINGNSKTSAGAGRKETLEIENDPKTASSTPHPSASTSTQTTTCVCPPTSRTSATSTTNKQTSTPGLLTTSGDCICPDSLKGLREEETATNMPDTTGRRRRRKEIDGMDLYVDNFDQKILKKMPFLKFY